MTPLTIRSPRCSPAFGLQRGPVLEEIKAEILAVAAAIANPDLETIIEHSLTPSREETSLPQ
jgi:hypothetical protein